MGVKGDPLRFLDWVFLESHTIYGWMAWPKEGG